LRYPPGGIKRELAAAKKKVGLLLPWILGLRYHLFLDFHWLFWQISDRRDREKKAFSKLFQPSGGSEKCDKVLFYYHILFFFLIKMLVWIFGYDTGHCLLILLNRSVDDLFCSLVGE
jgi:hypothetical protein